MRSRKSIGDHGDELLAKRLVGTLLFDFPLPFGGALLDAREDARCSRLKEEDEGILHC